jgi:GH15 family glucan-1,4-alpha-glucosidase
VCPDADWTSLLVGLPNPEHLTQPKGAWLGVGRWGCRQAQRLADLALVSQWSVLTVHSSIELLVRSPTPEGAIPAGTLHEIYQYGWLRDGSWCAYALDRAGRTSAVAAWHHWVASTLLRHERRVDEALGAARAHWVTGAVMMPARFTLAGEEETPGEGGKEWPSFQTDCYGFWQWAMADRGCRGGHLESAVEHGARLVIRYLMGGRGAVLRLLGGASRESAHLQPRSGVG